MSSKQKPTAPAYREGDVRVIYLPPATVAAAHAVGGEPEEATRLTMQAFVEERKVFAHKPDARSFGFNHPNGTNPDGSDHGYERWITIPDNWQVDPPLVKKQFGGGLYAARTIPFGAFDEWGRLEQWVQNNPDLEQNLGPAEVMSGLLEEELDYIHLCQRPPEAQLKMLQLDLLFPVKKVGE